MSNHASGDPRVDHGTFIEAPDSAFRLISTSGGRLITSPSLALALALDRLFRQNTAVLAWLALIGLSVAALTLAGLHLLKSDLSPSSHFISEYRLGDYGALLPGGLLALAIGGAALTIGLIQALGRSGRRGVWLLLAWISGVLLCAVFPTDPKEAVLTAIGRVHNLGAGLAFVALNSAILFYGHRFRQHPHWSALGVPSYVLGTLGSLLFLLGSLQYSLLHVSFPLGVGFSPEWVGLTERGLCLVLLLWLVLAAGRLAMLEAR